MFNKAKQIWCNHVWEVHSLRVRTCQKCGKTIVLCRDMVDNLRIKDVLRKEGHGEEKIKELMGKAYNLTRG